MSEAELIDALRAGCVAYPADPTAGASASLGTNTATHGSGVPEGQMRFHAGDDIVAIGVDVKRVIRDLVVVLDAQVVARALVDDDLVVSSCCPRRPDGGAAARVTGHGSSVRVGADEGPWRSD
jgi:hypothetical protein